MCRVTYNSKAAKIFSVAEQQNVFCGNRMLEQNEQCVGTGVFLVVGLLVHLLHLGSMSAALVTEISFDDDHFQGTEANFVIANQKRSQIL